MDFSKPSTSLKLFFGFFVLVTLLLFIVYNGSGIGTYGINKTIGWAWELGENRTIVILLMAATVLLLGIVLYLILALFKLNVNKYVVITQLILFVLLTGSSIVITYGLSYYIPITFFVVSVVLLVINTIIAIIGGLKKRK
jgi:hypothetical protein